MKRIQNHATHPMHQHKPSSLEISWESTNTLPESFELSNMHHYKQGLFGRPYGKGRKEEFNNGIGEVSSNEPRNHLIEFAYGQDWLMPSWFVNEGCAARVQAPR